MRKLLALSLTLLVLGCTPDAKSFKITAENQEKFMEEIKGHKLTVGEALDLVGYQMRVGIAGGLKGEKVDLAGKTVGDLIKEQREWQESEAKRKAEEERLAEEARRAAEERANRLREAITAAPFQKEFHKADYMAGEFKDYIGLTWALHNKSSKDIKALKGSMVFSDLFGDKIATYSAKITDPVKKGQKVNWEGYWEFNQFKDSDVKMRNTPLKDMKVQWVPEEVLFADGSKLD